MTTLAFIGFGEAASAFAGDPRWSADARAYDAKVDVPGARAAKLADCEKAGVLACASGASALAGAVAVLSLVTADQALPAARAGAHAIAPGTLWLDMNSVAPDTKRAAALGIERAGGRYLDVAVMAPVFPRRLATPLLVSGPHCETASRLLRAIGFANVRALGGEIGEASAVKMIRSVLVKGIEALTAECLLAADAAGVIDEVIASLDAEWRARADYNLGRMMVHGLRRAAEMEEVVRTLESLGARAAMARSTADLQRSIGGLGLGSVDGLDAKLEALGRLPRDRARDPRHRLPRPLHRRLRRSTRHGATRRRQRSRPARRRRHIRPFPTTRFARRSSRTRSGWCASAGST